MALYVAYLLAMAVPVAIMLGRMDVGLGRLFYQPAELADQAHPALMLLIFAIYLSLCCTFLPLPTGPLVAAVALRQFAPSDSLWITTAIVASVGALASMMANLHDYHLFTWLLRHRKIANVRTSRIYSRSVGWFARQPFTILVIFNVIPIPIDVIRMLAATYRYNLRRFAAANFIGRWIRYAVLAAVTFMLGEQGHVAVVVLLVVAVALGLTRFAARVRHRLATSRANRPAPGDIESSREKEL